MKAPAFFLSTLLSIAVAVGAIGCAGDSGTDPNLDPNADSSGDTTQEEDALNQIPWHSVGHGISGKDTGNTLGNSIFIAYAGYTVSEGAAQKWASALYTSSLKKRGVRHIYAVQGPADPGYDAMEIGNTHLARDVVSKVNHNTKFVLVVGHSSGNFVADEFIDLLDTGHDPHNVTAGKVVFFNLEGGEKYVSGGAIGRLRKAYYVGAHDPNTGTYSPNRATMQWLGSIHHHKGGYLEYNARSAGCNGGAVWCLHVSLVTTRPHDRNTGDAVRDYSDFRGRSVNHFFIDEKANEAGL